LKANDEEKSKTIREKSILNESSTYNEAMQALGCRWMNRSDETEIWTKCTRYNVYRESNQAAWESKYCR
jgi:hypothetical protein